MFKKKKIKTEKCFVIMQAEKKEKNATRPLPKPLLHRVRELAAIYPYPRKNKTRSSSLSSLKKGDQISFAGRIVHKRSLA